MLDGQSQFWLSVIALIFVSTAAVYDIQYRRIPNKLTVLLLVIGLSFNAAYAGWYGFLLSAFGLLIGGATLMIIYSFGGVSTGAVKLIAGVGALLTAHKIVTVLILTLFLWSLTALCQLLYNQIFKRKNTVPFAVAIALGTVFTMALTAQI